MEQIREKYAERDVEVLSMYVREPHAGEIGFRQYADHRNYNHKMSYACELVESKGLQIPILVDGMDQQHHEILGNLPNIAYVVYKWGKVEYTATWLDAAATDEVLAELVTGDDPSRPVKKTIETAQLGTAI